jgi:hypothetical protein
MYMSRAMNLYVSIRHAEIPPKNTAMQAKSKRARK